MSGSGARDLATEVAPECRGPGDRLPLYWHTVRYLRPGQIYHQLRRRLRPPRVPARGPALGALALEGGGADALVPFRATPAGRSDAGAIRFLNAPQALRPAAPDWLAAAAPKLWRYNLHYFDYLQWPGLPATAKAALVDDWIARVPPGAPDAWEPYPLSLRIVNWLKYWCSVGDVRPAWRASLDLQVAALAADVEWHLLANHLYKNGKALVMAGALGTSAAARAYLHQGLDILLAETEEQFLADGGHFERSPMYHAIALEDLLDVVNVLGASGAAPHALPPLRAAASRAARFLATIRTGHGEIPLFNDAALGVAVPTPELLAYATAVLGEAVGAEVPGPVRIDLPATGYFGYRSGGDSLVVDCGEVGPDYQPGHAHCDTLAYELCVDGVPVVVDSGTFDYSTGPFRHYLRSTAAHSTVRIDGAEQSEIWGAFRVARRARPRRARLGALAGGRLGFVGEHDGYARLPGRPIHRRHIDVTVAGRWEVRDRIEGEGGALHRVESFVQLHPAIQAEAVGPREYRLRLPTGRSLRLLAGPEGTLTAATGYHCPEFGIRLASGALVLEYSGPLPVDLSYVLERV